MFFAIRQQRYRSSSAAVGVRFIAPAYTYTPTKWGKKMRVWWNECVYLIMWICVFNETDTRFCLCQDTGTMNRPLRLAGCFATHFVGVRNVIAIRLQCYWQSVRNVLAIRQQCFGKPSAMFWQTVRSRRGRFIVPAYMKTPTKWRTEMCVRWCGNVYLIMWKCVCDEMNTHI